MSIFECTCSNAIHDVFTNSHCSLISTPCCSCAHCSPSCVPPCYHAPLTCQTAGLRHACGSGSSASARPCCPPSPYSERCHCDWAPPHSQSKHHPRCHSPLARVPHRPAHPYPRPHWEEQWGGLETKKHGQTEGKDQERIQRRERERDGQTRDRRTDVQSRRAK